MKRLVLHAGIFLMLSSSIGCKDGDKKKEPPPNVEVSPVVSSAVEVNASTHPECRKLCSLVGKCTYRDGKCFASSERECQRSFGCRTAGFCSLKEDKCAAVTDADCAGSDMCKQSKKCTAVDGRCEASASMPDD